MARISTTDLTRYADWGRGAPFQRSSCSDTRPHTLSSLHLLLLARLFCLFRTAASSMSLSSAACGEDKQLLLKLWPCTVGATFPERRLAMMSYSLMRDSNSMTVTDRVCSSVGTDSRNDGAVPPPSSTIYRKLPSFCPDFPSLETVADEVADSATTLSTVCDYPDRDVHLHSTVFLECLP